MVCAILYCSIIISPQNGNYTFIRWSSSCELNPEIQNLVTPSNIYYFRNAKELKFNLFSNGRPFWGELELEDRGRKGREGEIGKVRGWKVMEG